MKRVVSILLLLAAIGFFVVAIFTRQALYVSIGFLYLFSGLNLGRKIESNNKKDDSSIHESEQSTENNQ